MILISASVRLTRCGVLLNRRLRRLFYWLLLGSIQPWMMASMIQASTRHRIDIELIWSETQARTRGYWLGASLSTLVQVRIDWLSSRMMYWRRTESFQLRRGTVLIPPGISTRWYRLNILHCVIHISLRYLPIDSFVFCRVETEASRLMTGHRCGWRSRRRKDTPTTSWMFAGSIHMRRQRASESPRTGWQTKKDTSPRSHFDIRGSGDPFWWRWLYWREMLDDRWRCQFIWFNCFMISSRKPILCGTRLVPDS